MGLSEDFPRHRRRTVRLPAYDYGSPGAYFVTIGAHNRQRLFGEVVWGEVRLNPVGAVVQQSWLAIPGHFPHVETDVFVVVPNHLHGILMFREDRRGMACHAPTPTAHVAPVSSQGDGPLRKFSAPQPGTLSAVVSSFKSAATLAIKRQRGTPGGNVWQRNFYEHVIRNDRELQRLRRYISDNPQRWHLEEDAPPGVR